MSDTLYFDKNNYVDDLLDSMERGELRSDLSIEDYHNLDDVYSSESFNRRLLTTSKRFLNISTRLSRQKSDTSLDMSLSSETSNESSIESLEVSPFYRDDNLDEEHFNWELNEDYHSKLDDSKLDTFYNKYNPSKNQYNKSINNQSINNQSINNQSINNQSIIDLKKNTNIEIKETLNQSKYRNGKITRMRGKYHSFNKIVNNSNRY
jgi:hypothetical protein